MAHGIPAGRSSIVVEKKAPTHVFPAKSVAERHGSRTHPGREHRPADGFEDRGGHRTTSRPVGPSCHGSRRAVIRRPAPQASRRRKRMAGRRRRGGRPQALHLLQMATLTWRGRAALRSLATLYSDVHLEQAAGELVASA